VFDINIHFDIFSSKETPNTRRKGKKLCKSKTIANGILASSFFYIANHRRFWGFWYRRRRKGVQEKAVNEKRFSFALIFCFKEIFYWMENSANYATFFWSWVFESLQLWKNPNRQTWSFHVGNIFVLVLKNQSKLQNH